jgi:hypothetical protein
MTPQEAREIVRQKCIEANPFDRLSPKHIMMYLMHLETILKKKVHQKRNRVKILKNYINRFPMNKKISLNSQILRIE